MEKILLALDAHHLPSNTIDFACHLAERAHSKLTGLFLERNHRAAAQYIPGSGDASYGDGGIADEIDVLSIRRFRQRCIERNTLGDVLLEQGRPLAEVLLESRYADLVILDPGTIFGRGGRDTFRQLIEGLLLSPGCPVLFPPADFRMPEEILFIDRGKDGSSDIIRQLSDLLDGLAKNKPRQVTHCKGEIGAEELADMLIRKKNTLFVMV